MGIATTISNSFRVNTIEDGENGYSTVIVQLFRRSSSTLTDSDRPQDTLTYTFSTGALSGTTSAFNGWSQTIPAASENTKLYVTMATASSQGTTDAISASKWSTPVEYVADGLNSATVTIYKRALSVESTDKPTTSCTYTFATGVLSGTLNGWSQIIPTVDGNPCWVRQATAVNSSATGTIGTSEWSGATKLVEDGTSPWIADLDNEMDSVACDSSWHPVQVNSANQTVTTTPSLYYGSTQKYYTISVSGYSNGVASNGITVSWDDSAPYASNTITVSFGTTADMSTKKEFVITLRDADNTITRRVTLTVAGIKGNAIYNLVPSSSSISKTSSGYNPSSISCSYTKFDVVKGEVVSDSSCTIWYRCDDDTDEYQYTAALTPGTDFTSKVTFLLYTSSIELIDQETVNIVTDGTDGKSQAEVILKPSLLLFEGDESGNVVSSGPLTSTVSMVVDGASCVISSITNTTVTGATISISGTTISATATSGSTLNGSSLITVVGTYDNVTYTAHATLLLQVKEAGAQGIYYIDQYARSSSRVYYSSAYIDTSIGWTSTAPSITSTYPYIWKRTRSYDPSTGTYGSYSYVCLTGNQGATGRMYYMAGKFPDSIPYQEEAQAGTHYYYKRTDQLCPVVFYEENWWYLTADAAFASDTPVSGSSVWSVVNDFGVVLTEAIFVKQFAQFGSAIITDDWLISVHGTIDGTAYVGSVEEPVYYPDGSSTPTYVYFDSVRPTASEVLVSSDVSLSSSYTNITGKFSCDAARTNIFVVGGSSCDAYVYLYDYTSSTMVGSAYRVQSGSTVAIRVNLSSKGHEYYIRAYGSGTISYISVVPFIPNYAVDLKTGASYQQNAYVSGTIKAGILYHSESSINMQRGGTITLTSAECGDVVICRIPFTGQSNYSTLVLPPASECKGRLLHIYTGMIVQTTASWGYVIIKAQEDVGIFSYYFGAYTTSGAKIYVGDSCDIYSNGTDWAILAVNKGNYELI